MSEWKAGLDGALLAFVQTRDPKAATLDRWEDRAGMGGYCETCEYATVEVDFYYTREDGTTGLYEHEGSFADLLREL